MGKTPPSLFEVAVRVFADAAPSRVADAAYLFGQTADNQESVFATGTALLAAGAVQCIAIQGVGPLSGYPGGAAWRAELERGGIPSGAIVLIPSLDPESPIGTTLTESQALTEYARRSGWTSAYAVAAPFHQVRAFMTAASEALRRYPSFRLYNRTGAPLDWLAEAIHSQGLARGRRADLIAGELERIAAYQEKGDIAPTDEIIGYLNRREK
jgi:uncharacterized SAM-binding protein YcdF (DUF218 family)